MERKWIQTKVGPVGLYGDVVTMVRGSDATRIKDGVESGVLAGAGMGAVVLCAITYGTVTEVGGFFRHASTSKGMG